MVDIALLEPFLQSENYCTVCACRLAGLARSCVGSLMGSCAAAAVWAAHTLLSQQQCVNIADMLHWCVLCCRYHYNVANTRVDQHVEKGNDDGLYISSVACCQELWALIMDAGTGFTAQTYQLSNQFLPKEWIMVRSRVTKQ